MASLKMSDESPNFTSFGLSYCALSILPRFIYTRPSLKKKMMKGPLLHGMLFIVLFDLVKTSHTPSIYKYRLDLLYRLAFLY